MAHPRTIRQWQKVSHKHYGSIIGDERKRKNIYEIVMTKNFSLTNIRYLTVYRPRKFREHQAGWNRTKQNYT